MLPCLLAALLAILLGGVEFASLGTASEFSVVNFIDHVCKSSWVSWAQNLSHSILISISYHDLILFFITCCKGSVLSTRLV